MYWGNCVGSSKMKVFSAWLPHTSVATSSCTTATRTAVLLAQHWNQHLWTMWALHIEMYLFIFASIACGYTIARYDLAPQYLIFLLNLCSQNSPAVQEQHKELIQLKTVEDTELDHLPELDHHSMAKKGVRTCGQDSRVTLGTSGLQLAGATMKAQLEVPTCGQSFFLFTKPLLIFFLPVTFTHGMAHDVFMHKV